MTAEELRQIMYGWKLKVVPDPLAYPGNPEPGFRPLSSYNRHPVPVRSGQEVRDELTRITKLLRVGVLTVQEARTMMLDML